MVNPEWWGGKIIPPVPNSKTEESETMRVNPYYGGTLGAPVAENNPSESALDPLAAEVTREAESFADKLFKRNHKATRHLVVEGFVQGYVVAGRFEWPGRAYFEECVQRFGVIMDEAETFSGLDFETHDGKSYLVGLRGGFLYRAIGVHYLEYFWHWMEQQGESAMPEPDPEPETESTEEINSNEWQSEKLSEAYRLVDHARELLTGVKFLAEVLEVDQAVLALLAKAQQEFLRASGLILDADTELGSKLS